VSPGGQHASHGTGELQLDRFKALGSNVVFEPGVLVFHPETISMGSNIYVGHNAILKGYYKSEMQIGDDSWIGQQCMFHSAGGLYIGKKVGIGPGVGILTSTHEDQGRFVPLLTSPLVAAEVVIEDECDLGWGTIVLPGVTIGRGALVGAGSVVTSDVEPYSVVAGVPAKLLRMRE